MDLKNTARVVHLFLCTFLQKLNHSTLESTTRYYYGICNKSFEVIQAHTISSAWLLSSNTEFVLLIVSSNRAKKEGKLNT